jgi:hypothetical protein
MCQKKGDKEKGKIFVKGGGEKATSIQYVSRKYWNIALGRLLFLEGGRREQYGY